jgi:hypothetical protein
MALELLVLTLDDTVSWHDDQNEDQFNGARPTTGAIDDRHAVSAAKALADAFRQYCHEAHLARGELARAHAKSLMSACEESFIAACAEGNFHIQRQALAWMEDAERTGGRLALASMLSSRMVCAIMEGALGRDWSERFSVVATADAMSAHQAEGEQYGLILRTTAIPAHQALLVTASAHCEKIARGIGIHAVRVNAQVPVAAPSQNNEMYPG